MTDRSIDARSAECPGRPVTMTGRRFLRPVLSLLAALLVCAPALAAQEEGTTVLRGEVLRAGASHGTGMVVLHRVTPGEAGEVDSVAVSSDGRFALPLPSMPDPESRSEVYFASVRHLGILYFGPAISNSAQLDSLYAIEVFDTISVPPEGADIPIAVRNLFIEQVEEGWQATDLFQLRNDTDRTFVARAESREAQASGSAMEHPEAPGKGFVWSYPLPPEATNFQVGQSDLPPDAVAFDGSTVRVSAPLPPGERLYLVRYLLPEIDFELPMPGTTEIMELLILEPVPPLQVTGLQEDQPVALEPGSTYRRFAGLEVTDLLVTLETTEEQGAPPVGWIAVILALVLGVAGILALAGRPPPALATPGRAPATADGARTAADSQVVDAAQRDDPRADLLRQIAILDEAHAAAGTTDSGAEQAYRAKREALKERLRALR